MMPRPAQCDDDRCDYDDHGRWVHHPRCATQDSWSPEDMAASTAMEDGYTRVFIPKQRDRRAA